MPAQYGVKTATQKAFQKLDFQKTKMGNQVFILIPHDHRNINLKFGAEAGT